MPEEKIHARLSPSSADRWLTCMGSVILTKDLPNTGNAYSTEGTDYHEAAAYCLEEGVEAASLVGRPMKSGAIATEDNLQFVQEYIDVIQSHIDEGGQLLVEEAVPIEHLTGEPGAEGTSDAIIQRADRELVIGDLKFGRGVQVQAEGNRQAKIYALGAIQKYELQDRYDTVRLLISQPRNGGTSEDVVSMSDLLSFGKDVTRIARRLLTVTADGTLVFTPNLPLAPSEKACRFCKAKGTCPALRESIEQVMGDGFQHLDQAEAAEVVLANITAMPAETALGSAMDLADLVEIWLKGVRARVEAELLAGVQVIGRDGAYKLVQGKKGNRKWTDEKSTEEMMKGFRLKVQEMYDLSVISPASAEKLLAKTSPRRWEKLKPLYTQSEGSQHVANATDPRPALVMAKPEDGFSVVTDGVDDGSDLV